MSADCGDKSLLMDYLYGEGDGGRRAAFERHLATCAACRQEVAGLRDVRGTLQQWAPPEVALNFKIVQDEPPRGQVRSMTRARSFWPALPAWAQLAAAVLVLAVGAAVANLDVRFGDGGVTVRTGWQQPREQAGVARSGGQQPWRADLVALEQNLRRQFAPSLNSIEASGAALPVGANAAAAADEGTRGLSAAEAAALARRFQVLIEQSERRQQQAFENLLATRLVQFARDIDTQRRADLVRIQQGLGQVDTRTTSELAQMKETQRYLMRVANIQEIK